MTRLRPLLAALDRIATALEQLAPALTQATREQHQASHKRGRHEKFGKPSIPFWSPTKETDWTTARGCGANEWYTND